MSERERAIYWLGFVVRSALGLAAWWLSQHAPVDLLEDGLAYERVGTTIAGEWQKWGSSPTLSAMVDGGHEAWVMYGSVAVLSYICGGIGVLPILMVLLNFVTALVPVLTYRIARQIGISDPGAVSAAHLVVFSPAFAFWGGALYKEGLVFLALNAIVLQVLELQKRFRPRAVVLLAAALSLLLGLRFYMAVLVAPAIGLALLMARHDSRRRRPGPVALLFRQVGALVALVSVLSLVGFGERVAAILPGDSFELLSQLHYSRMDLAQVSSGYLESTDLSTHDGTLRFLPVGIFYFLTVPFPWQLGSMRQNLVIPEVMFWLVQYVFVWRGARTGLRRNFQGSVFLLSLTTAMVLFYGLFAGNVGTAYRLRAQVWLLWAVFTGWYWESRSCRRASRARAVASRRELQLRSP